MKKLAAVHVTPAFAQLVEGLMRVREADRMTVNDALRHLSLHGH